MNLEAYGREEKSCRALAGMNLEAPGQEEKGRMRAALRQAAATTLDLDRILSAARGLRAGPRLVQLRRGLLGTTALGRPMRAAQ